MQRDRLSGQAGPHSSLGLPPQPARQAEAPASEASTPEAEAPATAEADAPAADPAQAELPADAPAAPQAPVLGGVNDRLQQGRQAVSEIMQMARDINTTATEARQLGQELQPNVAYVRERLEQLRRGQAPGRAQTPAGSAAAPSAASRPRPAAQQVRQPVQRAATPRRGR
jgi:hypothetical protein